jgi:ubiquinone/menaquinone biosynthesis C-methylase UbiE
MAGNVCPVWVGYFLASPIRKLFENPRKILGPYVKDGMTVLDVGCAMGFFSVPLAAMVGPKGRVICVDVQEEMIKALKKRAQKAGLSDRIETRIGHQDSLGLSALTGHIDFALAFAVVHEVADAAVFFQDVYNVIKQHGKLLVAEPKGHVSEKDFEVSVSCAVQVGFEIIDHPQIHRNRTVLLEKVS